MKLLKHIINWIVWSLMALYIIVLVITHLPACQRIIGDRVASMLSEKLATKVIVGNMDLGFLNRAIINDITIYDQQERIMFTASRISVKMDLLPLTEGKISISSAQLFGAYGRFIKKDSLSKSNYQFVLDSLASKDNSEQSPLDLKINSLIIRHSGLLYDQGDISKTPGLFNPHHLNMSDISAHITLKKLTEDSIDVNIKRLGLEEVSGLDINNLTKLIKIGYIAVNKKTQILTPMPFGEMVFEVVFLTMPSMLNPEMTASWEKGLSMVESGSLTTDKYRETLEKYVSKYVENVRAKNLTSLISKKIREVPRIPVKSSEASEEGKKKGRKKSGSSKDSKSV